MKYKLLTAILFTAVVNSAPVQHYSMPYEHSFWRIENQGMLCGISQQVSRWGVARFLQSRFSSPRLELWRIHPTLSESLVFLQSESADWQHDDEVRTIGEVIFDPGADITIMNRDLSMRVYFELEHGRQVSVYHPDSGDGKDAVLARFQPIGFRSELESFQNCVARLGDDSGTPLSTVYFTTDSAELSPVTREELDDFVERYRKAGDYRKIFVKAFADVRGADDYNIELSQRRAAAIRSYLISAGVNEKQVAISAYGSQMPIKGQGEQDSWMLSRRAVLSLGREAKLGQPSADASEAQKANTEPAPTANPEETPKSGE